MGWKEYGHWQGMGADGRVTYREHSAGTLAARPPQSTPETNVTLRVDSTSVKKKENRGNGDI